MVGDRAKDRIGKSAYQRLEWRRRMSSPLIQPEIRSLIQMMSTVLCNGRAATFVSPLMYLFGGRKLTPKKKANQVACRANKVHKRIGKALSALPVAAQVA